MRRTALSRLPLSSSWTWSQLRWYAASQLYPPESSGRLSVRAAFARLGRSGEPLRLVADCSARTERSGAEGSDGSASYSSESSESSSIGSSESSNSAPST